MPRAVVLYDAIRWKDGDAVFEAGKGDKIDLPEEEFDRLAQMGAVAKPAMKRAVAEAPADAES